MSRGPGGDNSRTPAIVISTEIVNQQAAPPCGGAYGDSYAYFDKTGR